MVEIKINTDTSSKEDIRRAVEFLKKYLEAEAALSPDYDMPSSAMNIFGDSSPALREPEQKEPEPEIKDEEDNSDIQIKPIFY